MAAEVQSHRVFDGDHLRATLFDQGGKRLFVSFDSFRPMRRNFSDRGPVQFYLDQGWNQLSIQTARNDWYLNDDLHPLRAVLADLVVPYRRVSSMAFSMGGYGALLMSQALRLSQVFLVSPQVTPFSTRGPKDKRWRGFERAMRPDLDLTLADMPAGLRGFVLFDPLVTTKDRDHARAIEALLPRVRAVAMPLAGHPADKTILQGRLWPEFQALLMDRKCKAAALKDLHREGRKVSDIYGEALQARLAARMDRQAGDRGNGNSLP